jgi:hypothetical protein
MAPLGFPPEVISEGHPLRLVYFSTLHTDSAPKFFQIPISPQIL